MSPTSTRRAVVTGAGSGIGQAVARRLRREGVGVLAVDLTDAKLAKVAAEGCETLAADLADPVQWDALAAAAAGADYLVNAAGIICLKPILDVTIEDWRAVFAVNAEATFFLCQKIGPQMRAGGAIVNLSSSSAKLASTVEVAAYAASKTAILSITRSFAYALASRPIRVNAICPGIIDTPMQERVLDEVAHMRGMPRAKLSEVRKQSVPLGRAARPEECAAAIWFLLSDESGYMTGQAINYTGGLVMW
ncbi:MAG: SDR family oxidoreductase [Methylobacteriaceae bacterium]|nr:SDR family oxidoreductase [Methylobacteriaceae bacterium]MBV9702256.1 SDR family oxidoreductase [Methylobacteriaceae bacterium]